MEKLFLITIALLFILNSGVMAGTDPTCYVKTSDQTYFGVKVRNGVINLKTTTDAGSVVRVPLSKVKSYKDRTGYYEYLPLVNEAYDTTAYVMMKFVACKNGLRLFSYSNPDLELPAKEYYIFSNDGLYLKINRMNAPTALEVFGIKAR